MPTLVVSTRLFRVRFTAYINTIATSVVVPGCGSRRGRKRCSTTFTATITHSLAARIQVS